MFYSSFPIILQFVEVLKNVQTDIYIKIRSSNLGNKRREDVEKEEFIKNTMTEFENKNITRFDFVQKFNIKKIYIYTTIILQNQHYILKQ